MSSRHRAVVARTVSAAVVAIGSALAGAMPSHGAPAPVAHTWVEQPGQEVLRTHYLQAPTAMAYDAARGATMVELASVNPHSVDLELRESAGVGWKALGPVPNSAEGTMGECGGGGFVCSTGYLFTYDPTRGVIVGVGTCTYITQTGCTWTWDGHAWTLVSSSGIGQLSPESAMTYDDGLGGVVLAGSGAPTLLWTGSAWTTIAGPPMRDFGYGGNLAYDRARHELVFFGGQPWGTSLPPQTWVLHGSAWVRRFSAAQPPATGPMAYDPTEGLVILSGVDRAGSTWTWDGTAWRRPPAGRLSAGYHLEAMAFDATHGVLLGFAGARGGHAVVRYQPLP